jgi:hypothetical protein
MEKMHVDMLIDFIKDVFLGCFFLSFGVWVAWYIEDKLGRHSLLTRRPAKYYLVAMLAYVAAAMVRRYLLD